ncbi:hypothetical protein DIZ76_010789 [Coccidioides immitis]|nr:hypothetical protein DIZ76_010789 [Coccidioides immitis]
MKFQYILNAAAFVSVALSANTPNRSVKDPSGAVQTHKEHKSSDDHKYPVAPWAARGKLMHIGGVRGVGWNSTTLLTKTHAQGSVTSTSGTTPLSAVVAITGSFVNSPGLIETGKPSATKTIKNPPSATDQGSRTSCVGTGKFKLNFDDLPAYRPKNPANADFPPIFSPYHHLSFSNGWSYGPPPAQPFPPISNPHVGIFIPKGQNTTGGEIGAGLRVDEDVFWFNVSSAYFGCNNGNKNNTPCMLTATASKYSAEHGIEVQEAATSFKIPPCPGFRNCKLTKIEFGPDWKGLSRVKLTATVSGKPAIWLIDDIQMGWYNNTCAAGLLRSRSR